MIIKINILVPLVFLFLSIPAIADTHTDLQSTLENTMHKNKISDLSISVIRSGKTFYLSDLHLQSDGKIVARTGVTQFRIASISKPFTAQAVMQLREKGKLSLDDRVSKYIPAFADSKVTIEDLLTHYGGLQDRVWPQSFNQHGNFDEYLLKVLAANKNIQAGTNYQYSDTGFNILGKIISDVSGLNYQAYIERNILKPAKMRHTGYYSGSEGIRPTVEPFKNGVIIPASERWPYDPQFFPSEGLISNIYDLTSWAKLTLAMDPKLLTKESYQQMLAPHNDTNLDKTRIGWSWLITRRNNIDYAYHMGSVRGYESIVVMHPGVGNAIIILTNSSETPRWEIVDLIEQILRVTEK